MLSQISGSKSLVRGKNVSMVSSVPVKVSVVATGISLSGVTSMVTVCPLEENTPSLTWKVKETVPLKFRLGVKVNSPVLERLRVPVATVVSRTNVTGVRSGSDPERVFTRSVSSAVINEPESATGGWLVVVTEILTVPVLEIFPFESMML